MGDGGVYCSGSRFPWRIEYGIGGFVAQTIGWIAHVKRGGVWHGVAWHGG
jgi:hypothetical protein